MKLKIDTFVKSVLLLLIVVAVSTSAYAQRTISGTITDADGGDPLIGATVFAVGTTTGTITDFDGKYSINIPDDVTELEFSYTGYAQQRLAISSDVLDVVLSAGTLLDEVVVTGYGTQKAKEVTSSITHIDSEDFNKGNVNDPAQLLQGKVAGLSIARPGGNPNGGFNIRNRGLSTVGANTSPLIIVDGVPGASLNSVDPQDIESIDVLKDGSAAAIYGTRGASGVILITTKKGKAGVSSVEYAGYVTSESVDRTVDVLDASGYKAFGGGTDLGSSTNWFEALTRNAVTHVHNLSLSGGTKSSTYRLSINNRNAEGVAINTGFKQLNGRINLQQKALKDRMTFTLNVSATSKEAQLGFTDAFRYATIYNPTAPVRSSEAEFVQYDGYYQQVLFDYYNPVAMLEQNSNDQRDKQISANLRGDYKLTPELTVGAFYAQQKQTEFQTVYFDKNSFWTGADRNGLAGRRSLDKFNQLFEATGTYDKDFGGVGLKVLAGYSYQEFDEEGFATVGGNFLTDKFQANNLSAALDFPNGLGSVGSFKNTSKLVAFFGRVNFSYDDTYYLTASLRREGSTKFGDNNKWGLFPGISAGVTLSNLFEANGLDNLKLRVGYGVTGNTPNDNYLSILRLGPTGNFYYNGAFIPSYGPVSNANPDLKWETKSDINIGVDFALMDYKLTGTLEYYRTTTNDLILSFNVPVPPNLFNRTFVNVGELENSGLELTLAYAFDNDNWSYSPNLAVTRFFDTNLISLSDPDGGFDFGGTQDRANLGAPGQNNTPLVRIEEGKALGQLWGLVYEGINDDGTWQFKDSNGNGEAGDNGDREVIGNGLPKWQIGLNNSFTFGNLDFNFFLRGVMGHDLINTFRAFYEAPSTISSYNILASSSDISNLTDSPKFSSLHVEKGDFLKLDNLTLGYTVPLTEGGAFSKVRLYVSGQNLFTITGYTGVDPEVRFVDAGDDDGFAANGFGPTTPQTDPLSPGIDRRNTYFRIRSFTFGVNLGF